MSRFALTFLVALTSTQAIAKPARPATPEAADAIPAKRALLTVGQPTLNEGSIDLSLVTKNLEDRLDELKRCYENQLTRDADLEGEVLIHWGINDQGKYNHACISNDTAETDALRTCVNDFVSSGQYPSAKGQLVDVSVPFTFSLGR